VRTGRAESLSAWEIIGAIGNLSRRLHHRTSETERRCNPDSCQCWIRKVQLNLHDLLLRDWGTDLPITGGFGGSREDPIVITATDPETVKLTKLNTLRGIGRGRGIFWRTMACAMLGEQWPGIEQFKIETVELTDTQAVTQTENYYFDVSAMMSVNASSCSASAAIHSDASGLVLPYEIGWVHFDNASNNEQQVPGLGFSLHYKAPTIVFSVYVYDRGYSDIPDDVNDPLVRQEFDIAHRDFVNLHPNFVTWPDRPRSQDRLERFYRIENDDGREASLLLLTTARRRFIKARLTWARDPLIDRLAIESVDSLVAITRGSWYVALKFSLISAPDHPGAVIRAVQATSWQSGGSQRLIQSQSENQFIVVPSV
jgi:hypothetical protein